MEEGAGRGIGARLSQGAGFLEKHPAGLTFAGNVLSGSAEAGFREDQQQYYLDALAQRREEDEYNRSREKMLRDMILSGVWRN